MLYHFILESIHLFPQPVEPLTKDRLQRKFRGIDKLAQRKILGRNFIDTEILHLIDVERYDRFHKKLGKNIHRQYLIVLALHDNGPLASVQPGI